MTTAGYKYTGEKPLNREPDIEGLLSSYITLENGYDRNHSTIPTINPSDHKLFLDGLVNTPLDLSISQLQTQFEQHEVLFAMQCAGNRRHTMRTEIKEVQGIDWFDGAVMNCLWKGPRLRDVLFAAGIGDQMQNEKGYKGHVALACFEKPCVEAGYYGGSIPLSRAMDVDADCILALEMNGKPLTPEHGAPLRVVLPGILGARSVKWLNRITLQLEHSSSFFQQRDYKILPAEAVCLETAKKYWDTVPPMLDMPINSIIGLPKSGSRIQVDANGFIEVKGYAVPAGMQGPVREVEVSADDGLTWARAHLDFGKYGGLETEERRKKVRWAWVLWTARVNIESGQRRRIVARAIDSGGNVQLEKGIWNLRGVGYNAWGKVKELVVE